MFIKQRGFTFIEMMLAVGITALIIVLMSSTFSQNILNLSVGSKINDVELKKHLIIKEFKSKFYNLNSNIEFLDYGLENTSSNFFYLSEKEDNFYKKLTLTSYSLTDLGKKNINSYYVNNNDLIKEINGKKIVFQREVQSVNFNFTDNILMIRGTLIEKSEDDKDNSVNFALNINNNNDFVGGKFE